MERRELIDKLLGQLFADGQLVQHSALALQLLVPDLYNPLFTLLANGQFTRYSCHTHNGMLSVLLVDGMLVDEKQWFCSCGRFSEKLKNSDGGGGGGVDAMCEHLLAVTVMDVGIVPGNEVHCSDATEQQWLAIHAQLA